TISFSPDGSRIVTGSSYQYVDCKDPDIPITCQKAYPDHGAQVLDYRSGSVLMQLTGPDDGWTAQYSPNGRYIAWEGANGIKIADASTGKVIRNPSGKGLKSFSADSQLLLDETHIWNVSTGRTVVTFSSPCAPAQAFSRDAAHVASWTTREQFSDQ